MKNLKLFPLDLQFFADSENGEAEGGNEENDGQGNTGDDVGKKDEKTFTQEQVSRMMAREKSEGKKSVLKSLGFTDEDEAKKAINLFKAMMDSQKTDKEKSEEELEKKEQELSEYKIKAEEAENKLLCLQNGVDKDAVDDVLAIAKLKVTDAKSLSKVLSEMKKDAKYSAFFVESKNNGTGSDPGHSGGSYVGKGDYGKGLAERLSGGGSGERKSNFF